MEQTCVWRSRWLAVGWAVILVGPLALGFTGENHESITRDALQFLKPAVLQVVVEGNKAVDSVDGTVAGWLGWEKGHFDNCDFCPSVSQINAWYRELLSSPDRFADFPEKAAKIFGWILHFAQDFYAHSNWAETMQELGKGDGALLDRGIGRSWEVTCLWANHPEGVIIAQGEDLPKGWKAKLDEKKHLVTVTRADGSKAFGIISGTFGARDDCYDAIAMSHGELNKDAVGKGHLAYRLALNQTRHEWCRLESLVFRESGQEGLEKLRKAFIDPGKASPCGSYVWLEIKAQTVDRRELRGVEVHVQLGDGYVRVCQTGCKYVVATTATLGVEAPASVQGLAFIEWKLAERRPGPVLWWHSWHSKNSWGFRLADFNFTQREFVLIAIYGPPPEEGPVEGQTPPPGEIEPPPGG